MEPAVGTGGRGRRSGRNRRRRSWWNRLFLSAELRAGGSKKKLRSGEVARRNNVAGRSGEVAERSGEVAGRSGEVAPARRHYRAQGDDAEQRRLGWARNSAE